MSSPPLRASFSLVLRRALRGTCPACGLGRVFRHRFRSEKSCDACGWFFERGPGHWVGGSEINMIITFWASCIVFIALNSLVGFSWVTMVLAAAFTVGFSVLIYRPSRCVFFAFDYLIDPRIDASHGDDGRGDESTPDAPAGPRAPAARPGVPGDGSRAGHGST